VHHKLRLKVGTKNYASILVTSWFQLACGLRLLVIIIWAMWFKDDIFSLEVHRKVELNATYGILINGFCWSLKWWKSNLCQGTIFFFDVFKIDIINVKHQHFDFSLSKLAFKSCLFKNFTSHATFVLGTLFGHVQNSFWGSITFHGVT
jgi:hypothetical protein